MRFFRSVICSLSLLSCAHALAAHPPSPSPSSIKEPCAPTHEPCPAPTQKPAGQAPATPPVLRPDHKQVTPDLLDGMTLSRAQMRFMINYLVQGDVDKIHAAMKAYRVHRFR